MVNQRRPGAAVSHAREPSSIENECRRQPGRSRSSSMRIRPVRPGQPRTSARCFHRSTVRPPVPEKTRDLPRDTGGRPLVPPGARPTSQTSADITGSTSDPPSQGQCFNPLVGSSNRCDNRWPAVPARPRVAGPARSRPLHLNQSSGARIRPHRRAHAGTPGFSAARSPPSRSPSSAATMSALPVSTDGACSLNNAAPLVSSPDGAERSCGERGMVGRR
jgi:hypothetical protein